MYRCWIKSLKTMGKYDISLPRDLHLILKEEEEKFQ
jgi:hypothetical protein